MNFNKHNWDNKAKNLKLLTGKSLAIKITRLRNQNFDLLNYAKKKEIEKFFSLQSIKTLKLSNTSLNYEIKESLLSSQTLENFLYICSLNDLDGYISKVFIRLLEKNFEQNKRDIIKKIENLKRKDIMKLGLSKNLANEMFDNTTIWHFYACYGTISFEISDSIVRAPLICIECELKKTPTHYVLVKREDHPTPNELFAIYLENILQRSITFEKIYKYSLADNSYPTLSDFFNYFKTLFKNEKKIFIDEELKQFKNVTQITFENPNEIIIEKNAFCLLTKFSGGTLYKDLNNIIQECETTNIEPLLDDENNENVFTPKEEESLDKTFRTNLNIQITDLNIYQKDAILKALEGSLVINGPPGTGKSQVIVNLVANILASNKTAIVCAKKKVAMDVIYDRLGEQIRPFVLNGYKTIKKNEFYDSIKNWLNSVKNALKKTNYDLRRYANPTKNIIKLGDFLYNIIPNTIRQKCNVDWINLMILKEIAIKKRLNPLTNIVLKRSLNYTCEEYNKLAKEINRYLKELKQFTTTKGKWLLKLKEDMVMTIFNYFKDSYSNEKELRRKISYFEKKGEKGKTLFLNKTYNQTFNARIEKIITFLSDYIPFKNLFKFLNLKVDLLRDEEFENTINFISWVPIERKLQMKKDDFYETNYEFDRTNKIEKEFISISPIALTSKLATFLYNLYKTKLNLDEKKDLKKLIAIVNKRRKPSIDKIFTIYKNILLKIFPVWIAPMELISRLDQPITKNKWDYIIFDEASQVFTEEGITLLYRGKNKIVCGDAKQLRPTYFFKKNIKLDEDAEMDLVSEESLLDYCKPIFGSYTLSNHYRSKYSPLFQYSNHFYKKDLDNKGLLFADVNSNWKKAIKALEIYDVNGIWEDGYNAKEVKEVVNQLRKNFSKYESIIVITANKKQAMEIWKEMYKLEMFSQILNSSNPRIKVRNLETVQGDEADLVIISITYGKNPEGIQTKHFGPINNKGGECRLNVMMSRAKEKLIIIKSIKSGDFQVNESESEGIMHFARLISFCDQYDNYTHQTYSKKQEEKKDIFIDEVYESLKILIKHKNTLAIEKNYSVGPFCIDQIIKKKNKPILGIQIDKYAYLNGVKEIAKDIDKQKFLHSRGYNIYRITGFDWRFKRTKVLEDIEKILN